MGIPEVWILNSDESYVESTLPVVVPRINESGTDGKEDEPCDKQIRLKKWLRVLSLYLGNHKN